MNDYPEGTNWRWYYGKVRISYRPAWSASLPYITFQNGDAGRSFGSLEAAAQYMQVALKDAIQS